MLTGRPHSTVALRRCRCLQVVRTGAFLISAARRDDASRDGAAGMCCWRPRWAAEVGGDELPPAATTVTLYEFRVSLPPSFSPPLSRHLPRHSSAGGRGGGRGEEGVPTPGVVCVDQ